MARFFTLGSSSKGNCAFLSGGGTNVLVDAGISCRAICSALAAHSLDLSSLSGILITHEHIDHIRGLRTLLKRARIPLYATAPTLEWLVRNEYIAPGTELIEYSEREWTVGALCVASFATPHDASSPAGLRFTLPDGRCVGVATDLGHVTETVQAHLSGCDLVLLEANYDREMLRTGPYPYFLKKRVGGSRGHLSNEACAEEVLRLAHTGATRFVLGHLSENNNLPTLAYETVRNRLEAEGLRTDHDYILHVAPARKPQQMIVF